MYVRWKKFGVAAMINDDGMDTEEDVQEATKDHLTMNDLMEVLEVKYDSLREKILTEMASLSAGLYKHFIILS